MGHVYGYKRRRRERWNRLGWDHVVVRGVRENKTLPSTATYLPLTPINLSWWVLSV